MSEYAALHSVSLLLVGNNVPVSRSVSGLTTDSTTKETEDPISDSIPEDELLMDGDSSNSSSSSTHNNNNNKEQEETTGIETIMQPQKPTNHNSGDVKSNKNNVLVLVDENASSGPDETRWRSHGLARRRKILLRDKQGGGRDFSLSFDCSVQRYFSVAHWALEQFHGMHQNCSSMDDGHQLEELYVMGFRIIAFLTECLPKHPGFSRAPAVQERSQIELDLLRKCLEDVALKIDERVCNEFVDDGDLFLDSMIAAEMEKEDDADDELSFEKTSKKGKSGKKSKKSWSSSNSDKSVRFQNWVNFDDFKKAEQKSTDNSQQQERKLSESPTSETVGTTGTESLASDSKSKSSVHSVSETNEIVRKVSESDQSEAPHDESKEETEENLFLDDDRIIREDERMIRNETFEMDEMDEIYDMDELSLKSYSSQPFTLLTKSVNLNFLKTIACEPVLYETDSEAADSWANSEGNTVTRNPKSRPCLPSSSGVTPTSDPARIAFRDLMNKLPHQSILKRESKPERPENASLPSQRVSPKPSSPSLPENAEKPESLGVPSIDDDSLDAVVESEIQQYLDEKLGKERKPRRSCRSRRSRRRDRTPKRSMSSDGSTSSSSITSPLPPSQPLSSSYTSLASLQNKMGGQTSAFSSFRRTTIPPNESMKPKQTPGTTVAPEKFSGQDDWISFDTYKGGSFFSTDSW